MSLLLAANAHAAESDEAGAESAPAAGDKKPSDTEFTILPVVGGDSDRGIGGGYIMSLAKTRQGVEPYVWRIESGGALTGKFGSGSVELGYLDDYLELSIPSSFVERLRLDVRVSYTDEPGLKYQGLGNASRADETRAANDPFLRYRRTRFGGYLLMRYQFRNPFLLIWGVKYTHNELEYTADSRLARDIQSGSPRVRKLLRAARSYEMPVFSYGVGWDSRDDEVTTHRGQFHTARVDVAPGGTADVRYAWARINFTLRGYFPVAGRRLVFAARAVSDLLVGQAPFSELSRFDESEAIGGSKGVRGVPAQRYYGKAKLFSNLELRSELFDFRAFKKKNTLGVTAFFDSGRVFSDYAAVPELDGRGLGLKYGIGGGLRLAAGSSLVLRADLAYSPDADPIGAYLIAGHIF